MLAQPVQEDDFGYKMLLSVLRAGFQESNRVIAGFNDKAKSTITVSALVLGVIVAGTRVSLGLGGEGGAGLGLMNQLVPVAEVPVSALMGAGIVAIITSIVAIAAVRLDSPFGTNTVLTRGMLDPTKFKMWNKIPKERIYKKMCE